MNLAAGDIEHIDLPQTPMLNLGRSTLTVDGQEVVASILRRPGPVGETRARSAGSRSMGYAARRPPDQKALQDLRNRLDWRLQALTVDDPTTYQDSLAGLDCVTEFEKFVRGSTLRLPADFVKKTGMDVLRSVIAPQRGRECC